MLAKCDDPLSAQVIDLTRLMVHKHYCENDVEPLIALFDEDIVWFGAGENEFAVGAEKVAGIFRSFKGQVPKCNISDEHYVVLELAPEVYLCSGRMWIATDASTKISLRVHQRISTIFRYANGRFLCCHIHISNPYADMADDDIGFPVKMAQQSYQYLQEQLEAQKKQIEEQTALLQRLSFEDALTGLFNRNKFKHEIAGKLSEQSAVLGVACFDLNGLKETNDLKGHSAGDQLIRNAADQFKRVFPEKVYRIGGDEFLVIDNEMEESDFKAALQAVQQGMLENGISCAFGLSWRCAPCNLKEQYEEADKNMYQEKRRYYSLREHDRRRSP